MQFPVLQAPFSFVSPSQAEIASPKSLVTSLPPSSRIVKPFETSQLRFRVRKPSPHVAEQDDQVLQGDQVAQGPSLHFSVTFSSPEIWIRL